ncbi:PREDICTED: E3 ubiquitin-protein ligase TRIM39-like [Cyprinodon variegatus]|uniref:E3 ubiquitin-protein ligase TRIM39-like n=1 Tax=Cyprinodon variegatus TaxID=28743 RepID=UPI00074270EF|nr:PREDICTED: E3 ubiquitin-protein ligase TRIM39-like [Cyprinodon variegatus]
MASRPEAELFCSVCNEVFKDPVVLSCGHSFCKECLKKWWREKPVQECPFCKRRSSKSNPPISLSLKNLCEKFLQQKERSSEHLCSLNPENLKLFHLPDCLACRDSENQTQRRFGTINEAAQQHKKILQKTLEPLKNNLQRMKTDQEEFDKTAEQIKVQAQQTENQIKEQFKKLHHFLEEEEKNRLAALREEEQQKSEMMKKKLEDLSKEIAALSDTVRATEEELKAEDMSFLHNYKAAMERVQRRCLPQDPQPPSGALIDRAKHQGNLAYKISSKMRDKWSNTLVLDPNTAGSELILSEDLTSVTSRENQLLPDDPEMFRSKFSVLSSEGFNSGNHSWVVDVRDSKGWMVGVSTEFAQKKENIYSKWLVIQFHGGKYSAWSPPVYPTALSVRSNLKWIRVNLDWDKGELQFFDLCSNTNIHIFRQTFSEKMFPCFTTQDNIKMLPADFNPTSTRPRYIPPPKNLPPAGLKCVYRS